MSYRIRDRLAVGGLSPVVVAVAFVVGVGLLSVPFVLEPFLVALFITALLFALFGTAFNLLYGYTGLLSFGHAMFVAVAAYTGTKVFNVIAPALAFGDLFGGVSVLATFALALVLAVATSTLLAVFVGYFSVQLEEIYFAMITLSFSMAIFVILLQDITGQLAEAAGLGAVATDLLATNGDDGLTIPFEAVGRVDLFGFAFKFVDITSWVAFYYVVLLVFLGSMYALWRIIRSPFGTVCTAIRENPDRAQALGIDVTRHQWKTFVISGAFSGIVGGLWGPLQSSVVPGIGHWTFSAIPVLATIIGGPYAFLGPTIGAFVYEFLRWYIDQFPAFAARWQLVFGVILLAVVLLFNNGVSGGIERLWSWATRAGERYREDGVDGVVEFTGATVTRWARTARRTLVGWIVRIRRTVVG